METSPPPKTSGWPLVCCTAEQAESIRAELRQAGYPLAQIIARARSGESVVHINA